MSINHVRVFLLHMLTRYSVIVISKVRKIGAEERD